MRRGLPLAALALLAPVIAAGCAGAGRPPRRAPGARLAAGALLARHAPHHAPAPPPAPAPAPPLPPGARRIVQNPIGLSIEYPLLERALGTARCPPPALVATLRALGSPTVRVGGDTQDLAGPGPSYRYYIPPSFWTTLGCLARETSSPIVVGLNFAQSSLADERTMVAEAERAVPTTQLSFSLGNEPDLYTVSHPLRNEPGHTVPPVRPRRWGAAQWAREWSARRARLGPIRLEAPDLADNEWRATVTKLLLHAPPAQIDAHVYPTSACDAGERATSARLLDEHSSTGVLRRWLWLVRLARAVHRPAVISEANSVSCGGAPGLSDAPLSSVWAVRFVVSALLDGFQQVRFHSAGTSYDPFVFNADGTITERPLAGALFFVHRWIPRGAAIAPYAAARHVLGASIFDGRARSVILSSFASRPLRLRLRVGGRARTLASDTLTTASSTDAYAALPVTDHEVSVQLQPHTVVALDLG